MVIQKHNIYYDASKPESGIYYYAENGEQKELFFNNVLSGENGISAISAVDGNTWVIGITDDYKDNIEKIPGLSDNFAILSADKLDTSAFTAYSAHALDDYYKKTETSSKQEIQNALNEKQDNLTNEQLSAISSVSAIQSISANWLTEEDIKDFITEDEVESVSSTLIAQTNYLSGIIDTKLDKTEFDTYTATALDDYYTKDETKGLINDLSGTVSSQLNNKLDTSTFAAYSGNINNQINTVSSEIDKKLYTSATNDWNVTPYSGINGIKVENHLISVSANYALSADVYSKSQIDDIIANFGGFQIVSEDVQGKPDVSDPSTKIIYLTLVDDDPAAFDKYREWIWTNSEWECIGIASIDLKDYAKTQDVITSAVATSAWINNTFYNKTETSGKTEIQNALDTKLDTTAFDNYSDNIDEQLQTLSSVKLDTSAFTAYSAEINTELNNITADVDKKLYTSATDNWDYIAYSGGQNVSVVDHIIDISGTKSLSGDGKNIEVVELADTFIISATKDIVDKSYVDNNFVSKIDFGTYSGNTKNQIDSKLDISAFTAYSAHALDNYYTKPETNSLIDNLSATVSSNYVKNTDIHEYTAGDNIDITNYVISGKDWIPELNTKVNSADFTAYSATVDSQLQNLTENKLDKTEFDTYSASTKTQIDSKLNKSDFDDYSAHALVDYYTKDETSGSQQIADALNTKLNKTDFDNYSAQALNDYYKKSETSGKIEIQNALDTKLNTSAFTAYSGNVDTLLNNISANTTALSANKLDISAFTAYSATAFNDYYTKSETDTEITDAINDISATVSTDYLKKADVREYTAGDNIDITNYVISGKDWTPELNTKVNNTDFNTYSASTKTQIDSKLNKTDFNTYSAHADTTPYSGINGIKVENHLISVSANYALSADVYSKSEVDDIRDNIAKELAGLGFYDCKSDEIKANGEPDETVLEARELLSNNKIYLVKDNTAPVPDQYKEWIWDGTNWTCIGDTSISLVAYAKTQDVIASAIATSAWINDTFYNKTETSGKTEIQNALNTKLDTTAFNDYTATALNDIATNSGNWNASYTALIANSGNWNNTYNTVTTNSGKWENSYTALTANSALWLKEADIAGFATKTELNNASSILINQDNYLSGVIDTKLDTTAFNDYSANALNDYYKKSETSGKTEIQNALGTKLDTTAFNNYSANVKTQIDSKLTKNDFDSYSAIIDTDIDYLSAAINDIPAQVQSDWEETNTASPAYIQNKPVDLEMSAGNGISITEVNNTLIFSVSGKLDTTAFNGYSAKIDNDIDYISAAIEDSILSAGTDLKIEDSIISVNTDGIVENSADMSFVAGSATYASGVGAAAFGYAASAVDNFAFAEGISTKAIGVGSHAEGCGTKAIREYSHTEGINTSATNVGSHAEGQQTLAGGFYTHSEGGYTVTQGNYTHAEGYYTSALLFSTHAEGWGSIANGNASHAEGNGTIANASYSHAEGESSSANAMATHAEGSNTLANSTFAHAEGGYTTANGYASHAEGYYTNAVDYYSHAEGKYTSSNGAGAHAEGVSSLASGYATHVEGVKTTAIGEASHAEGSATLASGKCSHAEGSATSAIGSASYAGGCETLASGDYSHAEGCATLASGECSHAEGIGTKAIREYSHTEGINTSATNIGSHAEGQQTLAYGYVSHAEGWQTTASEYASHAEGYNTSALNYGSHAEGACTVALGQASHAEGSNTQALGMHSHSEGLNTTASGQESHAEGAYTLAKYNYTHAEGQNTSAIGYTAHAEGNSTFALGNASHTEGQETSANYGMAHAEGVKTLASGYASHTEGSGTRTNDSFAHAEGYGTSAISAAAHAEGWQTSAAGIASHAEGQNTIANSYAMHAGGMYNKTSADALFVIGNGTDESARSDAFIITNAGLASATILATSGIPDIEAAITSIPAQVQTDWEETNTASPAYIQNKPDNLEMSAGDGISITEVNDTLVFAVSGNYADATEVDTYYGKKTNDVYYIKPDLPYDLYSSTATYNVGDKVVLTAGSGSLYSAKSAVTTPGAWSTNSGKFAGVSNVVFTAENEDITELYDGLKIALYLPSRLASADSYLNINGLGDVELYKNNNIKLTSGYFPTSGVVIYFTYVSATNRWVWADYDSNNTYAGMVDAYVNLSASATNISAACTNFSAKPGNTINVTFSRDYTAVSAKKFRAGTTTYQPLYLNGSATSNTNYFIPSGTWPVYYDGDNWYLWTDGSIQFSAIRGTVIDGGSTLSAGTDLKIENGIISVNTNGTANSAYMAFVEGSATLASGECSHAEGSNTSATNYYAHAEGCNTKAAGVESHAEGWGTVASGHNSHTEGNHTTAAGSNSHAEGYETLASGSNSHAEGDSTRAIAFNSHAEGAGTIADNTGAHAEGNYTTAAGSYSHAEGAGTIADNMCSHAEGQLTSALGYASHAEGGFTFATNAMTHAEGQFTSALGIVSHAEGNYTSAAGSYSHAEGGFTLANDNYTHAEGQNTIANSYAMHAGGMYNKTSADALFVIGNGTDESARSDAFIITSAGLASATILATSGIPDIEAAINNIPVQIHTALKPEIYLYHTSAALMTQNQNIEFQKINESYSDYNSKNGTIGTDNTSITGLNTNVLYHCNVKLLVQNTSNSPVTVGVQAHNWVAPSVELEIGGSEQVFTTTYYDSKAYVYVATTATMELDWYVRGFTTISLSGINLTSNVQAGVIDLSVIEICND